MKISSAALHYLRSATAAATAAASSRAPSAATRPNCSSPFAALRLGIKSWSTTERALHKQTCARRLLHSTRNQKERDLAALVNNPPQLVSTKRKGGIGLVILAIMPITAFALGSWQVQRLGWKTELIARFEDRLVRDPLPLPPYIDPAVVKDFDYRRVYATGRWRHDQEFLVGPRLHDGADGYLVITPLDRGDDGTTILVNRGWIAREKADQRQRPRGVPTGEVTVEGLLREPWQKNMFTPENRPDKGEWYFPDIVKMAELTGSQPVWVEATMQPDLLVALDREAAGIPIGRAAEVNLRNNHSQYIFTWYALSLATSVMFWMVVKKPVGRGSGRVRRNVEW